MPAVRAPEFLTDVARTAVGNMVILTRARHYSGVVTIAGLFSYGVKKEHQGFHPLPAEVSAIEKELTPLSAHAFVRSMVRVWYHLRCLTES